MSQPPVFNWATSVGGSIAPGLTLTAAEFNTTLTLGLVTYGLIDYQASGAPDLSGVLAGHRLTVSAFANALNNGTFVVYSANNTTKVITCLNTARLNNGADQTGATAAGAVTDSGALIQEPSTAKQAQGYVPDELPNASQLNWMLHSFGDWTDYLASGNVGVILAANLTALAAVDTTGFTGRAALVTDLGLWRWVSGSALTPDDTVIDSDFTGQWAREFNSLSFSYEIDAVQTIDVLDLATEGTFKLHYESDIAAGFIDIDIEAATVETLDDTSTKDFIISRGSGLQIICRNAGSPFTVAVPSYLGELNHSAQIPASVYAGMDVNSDGTRFYIMGRESSSPVTETVFQYNATGGLISGASYSGNKLSLPTDTSLGRGCQVRPDGIKIFIAEANTNAVRQYTLPTPGSLSGGSYDSVFFAFTAEFASQLLSFRFSRDGLRLYALRSSYPTAIMYQYNLGSAYNLGAVSYSGKSEDIGAIIGIASTSIPSSVDISADGSKMLFVEYETGLVFELDLTVPFEIDSLAYNSVSYDPSISAATDFSLCCDYSGNNLYIAAGTTINRTRQWRLSTPFSGSALITAEFIK